MSDRRLGAPVPISAEHDAALFSCGEPALDEWLRSRALQNEERFSRTYVTCDGNRVLGYYALAAASVRRAAAPGFLRRNAPEELPAVIIARLAVDRAATGRGLGASLLADALLRIETAATHIGVAAVLAHAKSDAARDFYLHHARFVEFPADSRTLFLRIDAIRAERLD